MKTPDDADIRAVIADHPISGQLAFVRVIQDHRVYYKLVGIDGKSDGSLMPAKQARETIEYWRAKGWVR